MNVLEKPATSRLKSVFALFFILTHQSYDSSINKTLHVYIYSIRWCFMPESNITILKYHLRITISSCIGQKIHMLATGLVNYLNKLLDHPNMAHRLAAIARDITRRLMIPGEVTAEVFFKIVYPWISSTDTRSSNDLHLLHSLRPSGAYMLQ